VTGATGGAGTTAGEGAAGGVTGDGVGVTLAESSEGVEASGVVGAGLVAAGTGRAHGGRSRRKAAHPARARSTIAAAGSFIACLALPAG
jgi:hypothetical protein